MAHGRSSSSIPTAGTCACWRPEGRGTAPKWTSDGRAIFFTICRDSQERRGCDIYMAEVPAKS